MSAYAKTARRWIEPLLGLGAGGHVIVRFLAASADPASELGLVGPGDGTFTDYVAPSAWSRELTGEELQTLGGQFRQGAREVVLTDRFLRNVAAAQGHERVEETLAAAAGLVIRNQLCRIRRFRPLDTGHETYAWQLLCDTPLELG
jgi:hypothetical protein